MDAKECMDGTSGHPFTQEVSFNISHSMHLTLTEPVLWKPLLMFLVKWYLSQGCYVDANKELGLVFSLRRQWKLGFQRNHRGAKGALVPILFLSNYKHFYYHYSDPYL